MNYLWNKVNNKTISDVTFYITDDENREVDLNDTDISLTVVMKEIDNITTTFYNFINKMERRSKDPDTREVFYTI